MKRKVRVYAPCLECGGSYKEQGGNYLPVVDTDHLHQVAFGGMEPDYKSGGNWIPNDLKKGRCTPAPNPDCPKGSPQYNLAMTFKKHHGFHEKGGSTLAPQNTSVDDFGKNRIDYMKSYLSENTRRKMAEEVLNEYYANPYAMLMNNSPQMYDVGGEDSEILSNVPSWLEYGYDQRKAAMLKQKIDAITKKPNFSTDWNAFQTALRKPPEIKEWRTLIKAEPGSVYEKQLMDEDARLKAEQQQQKADWRNLSWKQKREQLREDREFGRNPYTYTFQDGGDLPKFQWAGANWEALKAIAGATIIDPIKEKITGRPSNYIKTDYVDEKGDPIYISPEQAYAIREKERLKKISYINSLQNNNPTFNNIMLGVQPSLTTSGTTLKPLTAADKHYIQANKLQSSTSLTGKKSNTTKPKAKSTTTTAPNTSSTITTQDVAQYANTKQNEKSTNTDIDKKGNVPDTETEKGKTENQGTGISTNIKDDEWNPYAKKMIVKYRGFPYGRGRIKSVEFDIHNDPEWLRQQKQRAVNANVVNVSSQYPELQGKSPLKPGYTPPMLPEKIQTEKLPWWEKPMYQLAGSNTDYSTGPLTEEEWLEEQKRNRFLSPANMYTQPKANEHYLEPITFGDAAKYNNFGQSMNNMISIDRMPTKQFSYPEQKIEKINNPYLDNPQTTKEAYDKFAQVTMTPKYRKNKQAWKTGIDLALDYATYIGNRRTGPKEKDLAKLTGADNVFTSIDGNRGDIGFGPDIPFRANQYTPVQFTGRGMAKWGGQKYQEGGSYDLTQSEIQAILNAGGEIEYI